MKFDYAIGNPPYQEEAPGESTSEKPVYHLFMDACHGIADKTMLITPARFLFNAGATPRVWNKKMLENTHFKVLSYASEASDIFPNTQITGGIAISYYDENENYLPINVFIPYLELSNIRNKVVGTPGFCSLSSIISGRTPYLYTSVLHDDFPFAINRLSRGHSADISSNAFDSLTEVFLTTPPQDQDKYCRVLGRQNNRRTYRWIKREYARGRTEDLVNKWKVFLPKANGASGMLGQEPARLISMPAIGEPYDIATDTFICVGVFNKEHEAQAAYKYLVCKFARALLGTLKVTQINSRETWANVPLEDFTDKSDIDWTKSVAEIDQQLYKKYGLTKEEIDFIETHVKEMA